MRGWRGWLSLGLALALGCGWWAARSGGKASPAPEAASPAGVHLYPPRTSTSQALSAPARRAAARGDALRAQGAFLEAAAAYRRALHLAPGSLELYYRAYDMEMYRDPAAAARIARSGLARFPTEAPLHLCLAEALLLDAVVHPRGPAELEAVRARAREAVEACRSLGGVRQGGRETGDGDAVLGEAALLGGDLRAARKHFRAAVTRGIPDPDREVDVLNALAYTALRLGDAEEARSAWHRAIRRWRAWTDPSPYRLLEKDDTFAYYLEVFFGESVPPGPAPDAAGYRQEEAVKARRRLAADLARHREAGEYDQAIAAARALMQAVPSLEPAPGREPVLCFYFYRVDGPLGYAADMVGLGDLQWKAGRREEARRSYDEALRFLPGDPRLLVRRRQGPSALGAEEPLRQGRRALQAGRLAEALEGARRALEAAPDHADAHALMGEVRAFQGDYPAAARHWLRAHRLAPRIPRYAFGAVEARMACDPPGALELAREVADRFASWPEAPALLAQALVLDCLGRPSGDPARARHLQEAEAAAARAVGMEPRGDFLATLGEVHYLAGDLAAAEAAFSRALEKGVADPEREVDLLNALSWIRYRQGDAEGMRSWLHRALSRLETRPDDSHAGLRPRWESYWTYLRVLGGEEVSLKQLEAREEVYRRLRRENVLVDQPLYGFSRDFLVEVARLRQAGRLQEAIRRVERFMAEPDPPQTAPPRMVSFYSEAIEEPQDRLAVLVLMADLYRDAGRPAEAAAWYRRALERLPGHPLLQARLEAVQRMAQP